MCTCLLINSAVMVIVSTSTAVLPSQSMVTVSHKDLSLPSVKWSVVTVALTACLLLQICGKLHNAFSVHVTPVTTAGKPQRQHLQLNYNV